MADMNLTPEAVNKLAKVIAEANSLITRQTEIIDQVIKGETEIGTLRIAFLNDYFDKYSKSLDLVARKQSSLTDTFLILDSKLRSVQNTQQSILSENILATSNSDNSASTTKKKQTKPTRKVKTTEGRQQNDTELEEVSLGPDEQEIQRTIDRRSKLEDAIDQLEVSHYKTAKEREADFTKTSKAFTEDVTHFRMKQYEALAHHFKAMADSMAELDALRSQETRARDSRLLEDRVAGIQEITRAELAAQKTIDKLDSTAVDVNANYFQPAQLPNDGIGDTGDSSIDTKAVSGVDEIGRTSPSIEVTASLNDSNLEEVELGPSEQAIKQALERRKNLANYIDRLDLGQHLTVEERENEAAKKAKTRAEELLRFRVNQYDELAHKHREVTESMAKLEALKNQDSLAMDDQVLEARLTRLQDVIQAEIEAQQLSNKVNTELALLQRPEYAQYSDEEYELNTRKDDSKEKLRRATLLEESIAKERAKLELYYKRKNNGILSKEDDKRIKAELARKFKLENQNDKNLSEQRTRLAKIELEKKNAADRDELRQGVGAMLAPGKSLTERKEELYKLTHDEATGNVDIGKAMSAAVVAVSDLAKQLETKIDEIGSHKGLIDTRLQGSSNKKFVGSYWDQLTRDMMSVGAVTPYFKQEKFAANIETLVDKGIAFDLKQRAFLMTIQEKIANTFSVADGTLLRLIRIQQEDSTAGRLGMESALNSFLNEMYETSEYLSDVASSVRSSLEEMEALATGKEATEIEFQVQKWMGSLYSVGMSQAAVQSIAQALGQIGAGQIEGITNGGTGNLLIMAANEAGLSIAELLIDGIDSSDTNKLMKATVEYLAEIAKSSENNRVVQQQLADVFGVKASDLRAATNLVAQDSISSVFGRTDTYDQMLSQLYSMAGSMVSRTSVAEMMTNLWENGQYTLASSMASNPVSYFIYKMAKVVDDAAGGIDLPFLNVMGFGVDLNTTVSDLMRVAAVGTGILGSIGPMISGLASSFSGRSMLQKMGIESGANLTVTPRGSGSVGAASGGGGSSSTSGSGYIGNSSGSDIKDSTIQESEDSKKQQMIEAKEEAEANQVDVLNETVIKIYELLEDVAHGSGVLKVKVEGYGLTGTSGRPNGAMAGLDGIANSTSHSNITGAGGSGSAGGNGAGSGLSGTGAGGSLDLGGWMLV